MKKLIILIGFLVLSLPLLAQRYTASEAAIYPDFSFPSYSRFQLDVSIEITPNLVQLTSPHQTLTVIVLSFDKQSESKDGAVLKTYKALIAGNPVIIGYTYNKEKELITVGILERRILVIFVLNKAVTIRYELHR